MDADSALSISQFISGQYDLSVSWRDVEWFKSQWGGPVLLKGVLAPEDAVTVGPGAATPALEEAENTLGRAEDVADVVHLEAEEDVFHPLAKTAGHTTRVCC